jgi:uncharacterized protein
VDIAGLTWSTAGREDEAGEWFTQSWDNAKLISPLLIGGVLVAGLVLGRPGHEGLIPNDWIARSVGLVVVFSTLVGWGLGAIAG